MAIANEPIQLRNPSRFTNLCEVCWSKYFNDCSGFVKAVAEKYGLLLTGDANEILAYIGSYWDQLDSGKNAMEQARIGKFVVGGIPATEGHGHVVIVVPSLPFDKYPRAYWGALHEIKFNLGGNRILRINGGAGRRFQTVNYAWKHDELPHIKYSSINPVLELS